MSRHSASVVTHAEWSRVVSGQGEGVVKVVEYSRRIGS